MIDVMCVVLEVQDKVASNGKNYWRVKTNSDEGEAWYTIFDSKISFQLKGIIGKNVPVKAKIEDRLIKHITFETFAPVEELKFPEGTFHELDKKQMAMYVSYAKDTFNTLLLNSHGLTNKELMTEAVQLVKQAIEEFEK